MSMLESVAGRASLLHACYQLGMATLSTLLEMDILSVHSCFQDRPLTASCRTGCTQLRGFSELLFVNVHRFAIRKSH